MKQSAEQTQRLEAAVAEYLEAAQHGSAPDRDEFLARYGDVASELDEFLNNHDQMIRLTTPVRGAIVASLAEWEKLANENTLLAQVVDDETVTLDSAGRPIEPAERPGGPAVRRIADYEIEKELGRGGMGVIFRARHRRLNRVVALKMVLGGQFADPAELDRFHAEAKSAAALEHPGIVSVFEVGQWQGQPFFTMALVEGPNLAQRLATGRVAPQQAARLLKKVAAAVAYAHARGIIHRDLKPSNILLASRAGQGSGGGAAVDDVDTYEPRITDFGLAKRLGGESQLTASGEVIGTPNYMPPEQATGKVRDVGPASDVYSLGAILYTMLTGRPPFAADTPVEVILQVLESEPPLPRKLQRQVPRELEWICLKCLEKKPADRYQSAAELGADLDRFLRREPPEARSLTGGQRLRRWIRRQPMLAWHAIVLGGLVGLVQVIHVLHPEREWMYHVQVTGALALWLAACFPMQWLLERGDQRQWAQYLWSAADAAFLTATLGLCAAPLGPLLGGYLVLICVSGLSFQTRHVAFTTLCVMLGYAALLVLRPLEARPLHYAILFETTLGICGLVICYQVWRNGVLREYYEDRRPR